MIHKAKAKCPNGHIVEFGKCNKETKAFFLFRSVCTSEDHEVLSPAEIQCQKCKTIHLIRTCPRCNADIPVSAFKQMSLSDRLKKVYK